MIDLIVVYIYVFLAERFLVKPLRMTEAIGQTATILLIGIPAYCYHLVCEIAMNGQSPGKRALGIRVMDMHGQQATLSQYLIRWSFRLFDMVITLGAAAVLSTALSNYSQRVGDMLAGTVVVDERGKTTLGETIYLDVEEEAYQPAYPEVMRLTDRDINGIRNLLDTKGNSRDTEIYMSQVALRICDVLKIDTKEEPREFLTQLLKDYNFLTRK